jgi:outer membrane protein
MNRVLNCFFVLLFFSFTANSQTTWSLQQCIDTALKNNIPVQRAGLQTQAAEVNWRQSKANLLPDLSADLSHSLYSGRSIDPSTNSYVSQNTNGASYGVSSGVVLFNGMTLQNRIKQNSFAYEASRMEQQQSKDELVLNVILAYLSVLNNEDQLQVAYQQASTTQAAFDRIQILNNQGAIKPSDVSDLKGQLMGDQLNIVTAKNILETSKLTLAQLMNKNYDSTMRVEKIDAGEFLASYPATASDVFQNSLNQFAFVKAVQYRKESALYGWKAAKGQLYPRLSLGGGINTYYSSATQNVGGNGKMPYTDQLKNFRSNYLGVGLSVPIFNHLVTRNQIKLANINLKDNELVEANTKQQLHQQIDQAYLNMTNAYERYKVLATQVTAYEESFKAAEVRFKAGVGTSIDYLTAKDRLDRTNLNLVNAKYDYVLRKKILDYYGGKAQ